MPFDFPAAPANGTVFAPPGGPTYQYNAPVWDVIEGTAEGVTNYWPTRDGLVAAVAGGLVPSAGRAYTAGGYMYVGVAGTAIIADLPGLHPLGTVTPYHFNGKGDGVTDDVVAINAAITFCSNRDLSGIVDMSRGRWLVNSADITVKLGVQLVGSWNNVGEVAGATYINGLRSSIILNPAYTINLSQDFSGIKGMVVLNKNLVVPVNTRQMIDNVKNFSGTAITVGVRAGSSGAANDSYVGYCLVIGFQYAYWSDYNERVTIEYLRGDNTNGVYVKRCYDMNHMSHCHMWGFVGSHMSFAGDPANWAVTGAANNGSGLVRLTLPTNILVTGDIVTVKGVTGTVEANGRWTITVIDGTHVDLQGSIFANAYVGPGTIYAPEYYGARHGIAYNFADDVDWGQGDSCFSYGYDIGFNLEGGDHMELVNCGTDGPASIADPTAIGFRVKTALACKLIGCKSAANAYGIWADPGTPGLPILMVTGHDFWGISNTGLYHVSGRTHLTASVFFGTLTGIYVDPASAGVFAVGNQSMGGVTKPVDAPDGRGQRSSHFLSNGWADATSMGNQLQYGNTAREFKWDAYDDTPWTMFLTMRKARGTAAAPTAVQTGDQSLSLSGQYWDGVDRFRYAGVYRIEALSPTTPTSSPGRHIWSTVNTGTVNLTDSLILQYGSLYPGPTQVFNLGVPTARWANIYGGGALNMETAGNPDVVMSTTGTVSTMNVWFRRGSPTPLTRWTIGMGSAAELGGNVGSDFAIGRFTDDGVSNMGALNIVRSTGLININNVTKVAYATAVPAGGTAGLGYLMSSTVNLGLFFGSGAPTLSAAKGSIYLNTTGSSASTRLYVNTDGATAWTPITTAT
jgi:hypothetical protein